MAGAEELISGLEATVNERESEPSSLFSDLLRLDRGGFSPPSRSKQG